MYACVSECFHIPIRVTYTIRKAKNQYRQLLEVSTQKPQVSLNKTIVFHTYTCIQTRIFATYHMCF